MFTLTTIKKHAVGTKVPPTVAVALVILCTVMLWAAVGPILSPHDPSTQDLLRGVTTPDSAHWLGTDEMGRDVFSRLIDGTRRSVFGPLCVAIGTLVIGASLGLVAGYRGGVLDGILNRFADLVYALPALLIAIALLGILGGSYWLTVAILVFLSIPSAIRIVGSVSRVQVHLPYIDSAKTLGLSDSRIMIRHVLPNVAPTVLAVFLLDFVGAMVAFSSLSFLGIGVNPGAADWGSMLAQGQSLISENPWVAVTPATCLILTGSAVTIFGDWLFDRLTHSGRQG
ncbi:ABC transporter permease [Rhodococcus qingshengii]|uniref:ABC transporter permease n=1 Tax=Rhodococcus qingshengii TaxID=334542 RepID=UPI0036DB6D42